jgi:hypothetical protein
MKITAKLALIIDNHPLLKKMGLIISWIWDLDGVVKRFTSFLIVSSALMLDILMIRNV